MVLDLDKLVSNIGSGLEALTSRISGGGIPSLDSSTSGLPTNDTEVGGTPSLSPWLSDLGDSLPGFGFGGLTSQSTGPSWKDWGVSQSQLMPQTFFRPFSIRDVERQSTKPLDWGAKPGSDYLGGTDGFGDSEGGTTSSTVMRWKDLIGKVAGETGVPAEVIAAIMQRESSGDPNATGVEVSAGSWRGQKARGLMQVMQGHFKEGDNWYDPLTNIRKGASILRDNYSRYGQWDKATAAYFGAIDSAGNITSDADDNGTTGHNYVRDVMNNVAAYRKALGVSPTSGDGNKSWKMGDYTPDQFHSGLNSADALSACGPAAAVAFSRALGRNPTLAEAVQLAKTVGWNNKAGMRGLDSQVALMRKMGISVSVGQATQERMAASIAAGKPVILDTPGHYFVAEGYDPATQRFNFANSARVLTAFRGKTWLTLAEVAELQQGAVRSAIYMD